MSVLGQCDLGLILEAVCVSIIPPEKWREYLTTSALMSLREKVLWEGKINDDRIQHSCGIHWQAKEYAERRLVNTWIYKKSTNQGIHTGIKSL